MSLQTGNLWRAVTGAVASSAMAIGLLMGVGAPKALADPATPSTETDTPPVMTADEALAIIDRDYDTGAGGGQVSNLIHDVMKLRALGFKPSNANKEAITKALDYRPNEVPLIEALKETIAYQRKMQALQQNANTPSQPVFGIGQPPPGMGSPVGPGLPVDPGAPPGVGVILPPG